MKVEVICPACGTVRLAYPSRAKNGQGRFCNTACAARKRARVAPELRFDAKVAMDPSGCWLWTAGKNPLGYGLFYDGRRMSKAHRFNYERFKGPVPDDLVIDHLCRNRKCVNPYHLEAVTHLENVRRGTSGSRNRNKVACIHGHALTTDNIYLSDGSRHCRRCGIERARQRYLNRRGNTETSNADGI